MALWKYRSVHINFNSHFRPLHGLFSMLISLCMPLSHLDRHMTSFKCGPIHMRFGCCLTTATVSPQYKLVFICLSSSGPWLHCSRNQCIWAFVSVVTIVITASLNNLYILFLFQSLPTFIVQWTIHIFLHPCFNYCQDLIILWINPRRLGYCLIYCCGFTILGTKSCMLSLMPWLLCGLITVWVIYIYSQ